MSRFIASHGLNHIMPIHTLRERYQEGKQNQQQECPKQHYIPQPMVLPFRGKLGLMTPPGLSEQIAKRKTGTQTTTEHSQVTPMGPADARAETPPSDPALRGRQANGAHKQHRAGERCARRTARHCL